MNLFQLVYWFTRGWFRDRAKLAIENLAYRQQLAAYKHQAKRPQATPSRPCFLGMSVSPLAQLAQRPRDRAARDRNSLAPPGV